MVATNTIETPILLEVAYRTIRLARKAARGRDPLVAAGPDIALPGGMRITHGGL